MAIDTAQKRFSAMTALSPWGPVGIVPSGTIDYAARRAIQWLYSGFSAPVGVTIGVYGDMNTRMLVYLRAYYSSASDDLTTLTTRYLNELTTGDRNQKMKALMQAATDAMV